MEFRTRLKVSSQIIDLTPLVDVIFLLLIFFIVTSDILPLKSLNIENPQLAIDSQPLTSQIIVVMDAQNVIYLGSKKAIVDLSSLKENLKKEIEVFQKIYKKEPTVVLSVDRRVSYDAFLPLLAAIQGEAARVRLVYQTAGV
jgi:biopolymer transport protein ExbD